VSFDLAQGVVITVLVNVDLTKAVFQGDITKVKELIAA